MPQRRRKADRRPRARDPRPTDGAIVEAARVRKPQTGLVSNRARAKGPRRLLRLPGGGMSPTPRCDCLPPHGVTFFDPGDGLGVLVDNRPRIRAHSVSHTVDWYASERSYPGAPRFPKLVTIGMLESRIERGEKIETERRSYICSRALSAEAFGVAVRSHWAIENNLHWTLDVTFNEDQSRLRAGHGARNVAVVRHFALNLVRQAADKRSIKRKRASWDPQCLLQILGPLRC
jgi:predicted transposase YbfD/YdcC